ncbi:hypothetical protein F4678DRAFT_329909 [Xylaria arbuscula]|nr:hypothetical protein F4678DRAFT_329909 [Xylaria arbuscula]
MGRLIFSPRDEIISHPFIESTPKSDASTNENIAPGAVDPWMVVVIVVGILIVATLAIFMGAHYIKSRQQRRNGFQPIEGKHSPYLYPQNGKSGIVDRRKVEDVERDMMIRKSLASRVSLTTSDPISQVSSVSSREYHLANPLGDEGEMTSLKEDWKAWEARAQTERRTSHTGGVGLDQHPAFASYLSVPQPTRMASPVRSGPTVYRHI